MKISSSCEAFVPTTTLKLPYPNAVVSSSSRRITPRQEEKIISSTNIVTARNSVGLAAIDHFFLRAPYISAFVTCSVKASLADVIAQKYEKKDKGSEEDTLKLDQASKSVDSVDILTKIKRNFAFFLYGGLYQGCLQMFIINTVYPKIFGRGHDPITVLSKALFDNFVSGPLLCLPLAYGIKGLILNMPMRDSFKKMWYEIRHKGLLFKYWSLWIPTQCLTFSVIPEHLRILFIAVVAFFWLIFLSMVTAKEQVKC